MKQKKAENKVSIFGKDEVNTGRQREMDITKGFLMVLIVLIHSFQLLADEQAAQSVIYQGVFSFFRLTGATLYLFLMGFGSAYSRQNTPRALAFSGVKLIFYQGLSNVCYGVCLVLPHFLLSNLGTLTAVGEANYSFMLESMLTFVNIFFIAGMGYLVLSLFKLISCPLWGYIAASLVVAVTSPMLAVLNSDNVALSWLLDMTFGGAGRTSFCFYPYLSFVLTGYVFGMLLQRVSDKRAFYRKGLTAAAVIVSVWVAYGIGKYPSLSAYYYYLGRLYRLPDLVKYVGSTAAIFLMSAFANWAMTFIERWRFGYEKLLYLSKHISKYYAVHVGVLLVLSSMYAYESIATAACLACFVATTLITHVLVVWWNGRRTS